MGFGLQVLQCSHKRWPWLPTVTLYGSVQLGKYVVTWS